MTTAPVTVLRRSADGDGFVIVAVLWILAALASFASIYSVYVVETASTFAAHTDKLRADALVTANPRSPRSSMSWTSSPRYAELPEDCHLLTFRYTTCGGPMVVSVAQMAVRPTTLFD